MPHMLVFDLYNTLIKITAPTLPFKTLYAFSQQSLSISPQDLRSTLLTQNYEEVIQTWGAIPTAELALIETKVAQELASVKLFPETLNVLTQLSQQYPLYLISNLASPYKAPVYDLGLDRFFQQMIFSCDVGYQKPQKQIFSLITGSSQGNMLMIGDSAKADVQGAQKMGWKHWWLQRGKAFDAQKRTIGSLQDLANLYL